VDQFSCRLRTSFRCRLTNATGAIRERWAGASWIIELVSAGRRDGKLFHHVHLFITTLRTEVDWFFWTGPIVNL